MTKTLVIIGFLTLLCPKTEIINNSTEQWNSTDQENFIHASRRCKEIFPEAPCLKKFFKVKALQYRALCGI